MSSVNVDYEDLIRFKNTLDRNANHFEEISTNIGNNINAVMNTDWQDQKSAQFSEKFFNESAPDIANLVETMRRFSAYLQTKIDVLQQYIASNINF